MGLVAELEVACTCDRNADVDQRESEGLGIGISVFGFGLNTNGRLVVHISERSEVGSALFDVVTIPSLRRDGEIGAIDALCFNGAHCRNRNAQKCKCVCKKSLHNLAIFRYFDSGCKDSQFFRYAYLI